MKKWIRKEMEILQDEKAKMEEKHPDFLSSGKPVVVDYWYLLVQLDELGKISREIKRKEVIKQEKRIRKILSEMGKNA